MLRLNLDEQPALVHCYQLGDSAAMILRPSEEQRNLLGVAEKTEAKMHANGAPYQLAGGTWKSDAIEDGETSVFQVAPGDVVLCFTDGLSNNVPAEEICQIASAAPNAAEMAKTLVERARRVRRVDDDVTVVALKLGTGPPVAMEPLLTDEAPWEKLGLRFT